MVVDEVVPARALDLESWRSIPAWSPVWDEIEPFVEGLREIAAAKCAERESGRNALRDALAQLAADFSEDLEYFEAPIAAWDAEAVDRTEAQAAADRVLQLAEELKSRRELQEAPHAHYAEARRIREQISALEDTIYQHLEALSEAFAGKSASASQTEFTAAVAREVVPPKVEADGHLPTPVAAASEPETGSVDESLHAVIDPANRRYSPLTHAQERAILESPPGVGMIFASSAFGFEHLGDAIQRLAGSAGACGIMPPNFNSEKETREWISEFAGSNPSAIPLLAYQLVPLGSPEFLKRIHAAMQLFDQGAAGNLHLVYLLAPAAVSSWLSHPAETREALASRMNPVFALEPWTTAAIQDRISRDLKPQPNAFKDQVLEATAGWYWCLDKLFELCGQTADTKSALASLGRKLLPGGELHDELIMRTGARPGTVPQKVLEYVRSHGSVSLSRIDPAALGDGVSLEDIRAAVEFLEITGCVNTANGKVHPVPLLAHTLGAIPLAT